MSPQMFYDDGPRRPVEPYEKRETEIWSCALDTTQMNLSPDRIQNTCQRY